MDRKGEFYINAPFILRAPREDEGQPSHISALSPQQLGAAGHSSRGTWNITLEKSGVSSFEYKRCQNGSLTAGKNLITNVKTLPNMYKPSTQLQDLTLDRPKTEPTKMHNLGASIASREGPRYRSESFHKTQMDIERDYQPFIQVGRSDLAEILETQIKSVDYRTSDVLSANAINKNMVANLLYSTSDIPTTISGRFQVISERFSDNRPNESIFPPVTLPTPNQGSITKESHKLHSNILPSSRNGFQSSSLCSTSKVVSPTPQSHLRFAKARNSKEQIIARRDTKSRHLTDRILKENYLNNHSTADRSLESERGNNEDMCVVTSTFKDNSTRLNASQGNPSDANSKDVTSNDGNDNEQTQKQCFRRPAKKSSQKKTKPSKSRSSSNESGKRIPKSRTVGQTPRLEGSQRPKSDNKDNSAGSHSSLERLSRNKSYSGSRQSPTQYIKTNQSIASQKDPNITKEKEQITTNQRQQNTPNQKHLTIPKQKEQNTPNLKDQMNANQKEQSILPQNELNISKQKQQNVPNEIQHVISNQKQQRQQTTFQKQQQNNSIQKQQNTSIQKQTNISVQKQTNISVQKQPNIPVQKQPNILHQKQMNVPVQKQQNVPVQKQQNVPVQKQQNVPFQKQQNVPGQKQNVPIQKQMSIPIQKQQNVPIPKQQNVLIQKQHNIALQKQQNIPLQKQQNIPGPKPLNIPVQRQHNFGIQKQQNIGTQKQNIAIQKQQNTANQKQQNIAPQKQHSTSVQKQQNITIDRQHSVSIQKQHVLPIQRQQNITIQKQRNVPIHRQQHIINQRDQNSQKGQSMVNSSTDIASSNVSTVRTDQANHLRTTSNRSRDSGFQDRSITSPSLILSNTESRLIKSPLFKQCATTNILPSDSTSKSRIVDISTSIARASKNSNTVTNKPLKVCAGRNKLTTRPTSLRKSTRVPTEGMSKSVQRVISKQNSKASTYKEKYICSRSSLELYAAKNNSFDSNHSTKRRTYSNKSLRENLECIPPIAISKPVGNKPKIEAIVDTDQPTLSLSKLRPHTRGSTPTQKQITRHSSADLTYAEQVVLEGGSSSKRLRSSQSSRDSGIHDKSTINPCPVNNGNQAVKNSSASLRRLHMSNRSLRGSATKNKPMARHISTDISKDQSVSDKVRLSKEMDTLPRTPKDDSLNTRNSENYRTSESISKNHLSGGINGRERVLKTSSTVSRVSVYLALKDKSRLASVPQLSDHTTTYRASRDRTKKPHHAASHPSTDIESKLCTVNSSNLLKQINPSRMSQHSKPRAKCSQVSTDILSKEKSVVNTHQNMKHRSPSNRSARERGNSKTRPTVSQMSVVPSSKEHSVFGDNRSSKRHTSSNRSMKCEIRNDIPSNATSINELTVIHQSYGDNIKDQVQTNPSVELSSKTKCILDSRSTSKAGDECTTYKCRHHASGTHAETDIQSHRVLSMGALSKRNASSERSLKQNASKDRWSARRSSRENSMKHIDRDRQFYSKERVKDQISREKNINNQLSQEIPTSSSPSKELSLQHQSVHRHSRERSISRHSNPAVHISDGSIRNDSGVQRSHKRSIGDLYSGNHGNQSSYDENKEILTIHRSTKSRKRSAYKSKGRSRIDKKQVKNNMKISSENLPHDDELSTYSDESSSDSDFSEHSFASFVQNRPLPHSPVKSRIYRTMDSQDYLTPRLSSGVLLYRESSVKLIPNKGYNIGVSYPIDPQAKKPSLRSIGSAIAKESIRGKRITHLDRAGGMAEQVDSDNFYQPPRSQSIIGHDLIAPPAPRETVPAVARSRCLLHGIYSGPPKFNLRLRSPAPCICRRHKKSLSRRGKPTRKRSPYPLRQSENYALGFQFKSLPEDIPEKNTRDHLRAFLHDLGKSIVPPEQYRGNITRRDDKDNHTCIFPFSVKMPDSNCGSTPSVPQNHKHSKIKRKASQ